MFCRHQCKLSISEIQNWWELQKDKRKTTIKTIKTTIKTAKSSSEETSSGLFCGFVTQESLFIEQTLQDIFNTDESRCSITISVCFHFRFLPRRHRLYLRLHHIPSSPIHGEKKSFSFNKKFQTKQFLQFQLPKLLISFSRRKLKPIP